MLRGRRKADRLLAGFFTFSLGQNSTNFSSSSIIKLSISSPQGSHAEEYSKIPILLILQNCVRVCEEISFITKLTFYKSHIMPDPLAGDAALIGAAAVGAMVNEVQTLSFSLNQGGECRWKIHCWWLPNNLRPGRPKRACCPPLNPTQASELYDCFLRDTLDIMRKVPDVQRVIAYLSENGHGSFQRPGA